MKKTSIRLGALLALAFMFCLSHTTLAQGKTSTSAHEISNEDLKEYVGKYDPESSGQTFSITISLDGDDRLMAQPTDKSQPLTLLGATAKDKFDLVGTGGLKISFTRGDDDKIVSLTFSAGGQSFTAKRVDE